MSLFMIMAILECCWKQNQPRGIWMTPYKMQNLVHERVDFSKSSQIWAKIDSNLRKFWKNQTILLKIWPKIGLIGIWMGNFSLKIVICMGQLSNFTVALPYQNQTWEPSGWKCFTASSCHAECIKNLCLTNLYYMYLN